MPALANVVAAAQQIGSNATQLSTGTSATVTAAAMIAMATASRATNRGHSSPQKAARAAPSSPQAFGSPSRLPSSAPARVIAFHSMNTPAPVAQKPSLRSRWSG